MKPRLPNTTINEARIFKMVNDVDNLKVTTERQLDGKFAEIEGVLTDTKDTVKEAKTVIGEAKNKIQELGSNFENLSNEVVDVLKEIKETGLKGDKGDDADEEAMEGRLLAKIPKLENIVKELPTKDEIVKEVIKQIPKNKPSLKIIQESIDIEEVANKVEEKLNEKPFEIDRVNGLKGKLDNITRDVARKAGYSGGGDTVAAGTNITITTNNAGAKVINATGGGGSITLQTDGTPNGSQTLLNLEAGTNVTLTDNGTGTVTIDATGGGGSGTVTSVTSANGDATVADSTTTPVITIVSAPKLTTARTIGTLTGDATSAGSTFDGTANNTNALTLATVNSNVGSFGSATQAGTFTVNAKGLITAASNTTITPDFGNVTGGTAGSIIFSNGTTLAQKNSNFFWDDTNNRLGVGTATPTAKLHVRGGNTVYTSASGLINGYTSNASAPDFGGSIYLGGESGLGTTPWPFGGFAGRSEGTNTYAGYLQFVSSAAGGTVNERMRITSTGNVGIGTTAPTAYLHIKAGTATASTAPLKFTSGTLNTTAEAGAVEFLTDDYYATITTGAARKGIVLNDGVALTSGRVPFATTNGRLTDDADMTFATDTLTVTKFAGALNGTVGATTPNTGSFTTVTTSGNIELGNASDTTLSRSAAGQLAVEGIRVKTTTPLVLSAASYTTDTGTSLNMDNLDMFIITAQAGALLFNAPGGTLVQGRTLVIRIKDNGTARALTWNSVFRAMGTALPSTTVLSKTLYLGFFYNSTDTKWDLVASAQEA